MRKPQGLETVLFLGSLNLELILKKQWLTFWLVYINAA